MIGSFAALTEPCWSANAVSTNAASMRRLLISVPVVKLVEDEPQAALHLLQRRRQRAGTRDGDKFVALVYLSSVQLDEGDARAAAESICAATLRTERRA